MVAVRHPPFGTFTLEMAPMLGVQQKASASMIDAEAFLRFRDTEFHCQEPEIFQQETQLLGLSACLQTGSVNVH